MHQPDFRLGLRVPDVQSAQTFYAGLGFQPVGGIPDADDRLVFSMLQRGEVFLIVDALVGMPFPDSPRERQVQRGPRGLGVAIGLSVDDLEATYAYCVAAGCQITSEPMDEAWGDRVFECLDPFGYVWEFSHPVSGELPADGLAAARDAWFSGR